MDEHVARARRQRAKCANAAAVECRLAQALAVRDGSPDTDDRFLCELARYFSVLDFEDFAA